MEKAILMEKIINRFIDNTYIPVLVRAALKVVNQHNPTDEERAKMLGIVDKKVIENATNRRIKLLSGIKRYH